MVHEEDPTLCTRERFLDAPDRGKTPDLRYDRRDERAVDPRLGPEVCKFLEDRDGRGFPEVVDVLPAGEVDDMHLHELVRLAGDLGEAVRSRGSIVRKVADWSSCRCRSVHDK